MPRRAPTTLREFAKLHPEVEGVVQHVGRATWDLLLVDVEGSWVREEFASEDDARAACAELGIRVRTGWDDPRIVRRMNVRDHWSDPEGQRRAL